MLLSPIVRAQNNPVPQINQPLVPASVAPAGAAFTLTVNGTGFVSSATVDWNGSPRGTTFISSTQLTAQINATDIATPGTASVTVVNPAPGGGASNVVFLQVTTAATQVSFTNSNLAVGSGPVAVVTADFNEDGLQDLATSNQDGNSVSILLGSGGGLFQTHVDYATGLGPADVVAGDFNGDGELDLATVNAGENTLGQPANTVSILLGNGDGTFQPNVDYPTGQFPVHLVAADFNRDGFLDLATVNEGTNSVSVLLGNGNGTFQSHVDYSVGSLPMGLAVSDFNGDSIPDLAAVNYESHTISILLGNGDGTFQPAVDYSAPTYPLAAVAADFNGDGHQDLAIATFGSSAVAVLLGNGDGTFGNYVKYATGPYPESVVTGDFNGDGVLDLALGTDNLLGSVSVLLGNGDGSFQSVTNFPAGLLPIGVSTGDFNGDGLLDLAAADLNGNTVSVLLQTTVLLAPSTLTFASQGLGTTSPPQAVTVTNIGNATLTISSVSTAVPFAETDNCGTPLAPGANCTVNVTFSPTTPGTANGSLTLSDGAVGSPQVVSLTGTGSGSTVTLNPSSLNYGNVQVNQNSTQTVTLTNGGNTTLTITSVTASGDYSVVNQCGSTVAAGASCSLNVTFTPSTTGTRTGTLTVTDNAIGSPQTASLTGTGVQGVAVVSPLTLTFATQLIGTTSPSQAVTLSNTGTAAFTVNNITTTGDYTQTNNCGSSVAAGANCTINVTFTPTQIGTRNGNLNISDTAPGSPQTVTLTGTGTAINLVPSSLNFGTVNLGQTSSPMNVVMSNTSSTSVTITSITLTGADPTEFGQTNTCGSSLAGGTSCTFTVTFTPAASGLRTASLTISDTGGASPQNVALSGTGGAPSPPVATLNPTSLTFAPTNVGSSSSPQSVTLTNTGGSALNITSITPSGSFSLTSLCGASLNPGQSCTFSVTYNATAMGTQTGSVTVVDNATPNTQTVSLTGTGLQGQPVFSPTSLTFLTQLINTTSLTSNITLTNTGNTSLTITRITASGNFAETNTCGSSVGMGASCTISVTFTPTGSGTRSGSVTVTDSGPASPQTISLTGTGTVMSVVPLALSWGTINLGQSGAAQTVVLTNLGSNNVGSLSASIIGADPLDFTNTNTTCGSVLNAGAICTYTVTFTPSASGLRTASLSISYGASGGGSPQNVALSGTGGNSSPPAVTFTPSSLGFGSINVGSSSTLGLTLTNTGGSNLTVSNVSTGGDYTETNTCSASIAPGQSCSISVTFKPSIMGTDNGTLIVTDNANNSPQSVSLTGIGLQPQVSLSPTSLTFGTQLINTTSPAQNVTLTNTGNATLSVTKITVSGSVFAETNTCGSSVNAGASCTISVTFTPAGAGTPTGSVNITDNAPNSPQTVSLSGTGTILSVSPLSLSWGTVNLGQSGATENVTLVNKGSFSVGSLGASLVGADPADFSFTTTCGLSLSAGASCTYSVKFTPSASGLRTASLSISYGASGGGSPQNVALSGTGGNSSPPAVTFTPSSLGFGSINVGSSSTLGLTVTNTGGSDLTVSNVAAGGDYTETNTCSASIAPGQSCSISVTFKPTIMGTDDGTLTVTDNANNSPQSVSLTGTGLQAQVSLSGTTLTFSTQVINTTSPAQNVTLTNIGNATLNVTKITVSGMYAETNTCGSSVNAGASCTISVTFTPTSAGTHTSTVNVTDNAPTSPQTVSLTGTGTTLSVSPLSLSWGTINLGQSGAAQNVTLTNKGTSTVGSLSASLTGADPADFKFTTTCTSSLSAGATCTYTVTFTPAAPGARSASLSISYSSNAGGSPQNVALSGTGGSAGPPAVTFTPSSLGFGSVNVGSSSTLSLTLTNTGGSNLTVSNVAAGGDYTETNTCSASIAPGQSCSISVTFKPTIMGADNGTLTVTDNANNSPQSVSLTGTGLQAQVSLSTTSLTFATQVVNTTSPAQNVTLTNTGNTTLSVTKITVSGMYAETNTCGSSVNAGASCTISVTFTPTSAGTHTGTVNITDNAPNSPQSVSLTGTGTNLSVSPLALTWGSVKVGTSGASQTVTLNNKGTSTIGSLSASVTGADPSDFTFTTTCSSSLSAGASCTYSVTFKPTATGSRTASLSISYGSSGGGSPQTVSLSGTGD